MNEPVVLADQDGLIELCGEVVAAYVSHNAVSTSDLPKLIGEVYAAFKGLGTPQVEEVVEPLKPAVSVRKSITPDFIISLEDGKRFKSLKRHLATLDMTPEQYRAKWSLPSDYPMVAPNYSETRSALAKSNGLGRKAGEPTKKARRPARMAA